VHQFVVVGPQSAGKSFVLSRRPLLEPSHGAVSRTLSAPALPMAKRGQGFLDLACPAAKRVVVDGDGVLRSAGTRSRRHPQQPPAVVSISPL
jgi:hypothetical protein